MPFKSEAQRRFLYAKRPDVARRWEEETPTGRRLPRKLGKKTRPKRRSRNA